MLNTALALLIVVNVGAVILESVEPIRASHPFIFIALEHAATAIFTVEYVLRLWTAVDLHSGRFREPLQGRLRYALSFFALDLPCLSCRPFLACSAAAICACFVCCASCAC